MNKTIKFISRSAFMYSERSVYKREERRDSFCFCNSANGGSQNWIRWIIANLTQINASCHVHVTRKCLTDSGGSSNQCSRFCRSRRQLQQDWYFSECYQCREDHWKFLNYIKINQNWITPSRSSLSSFQRATWLLYDIYMTKSDLPAQILKVLLRTFDRKIK